MLERLATVRGVDDLTDAELDYLLDHDSDGSPPWYREDRPFDGGDYEDRRAALSWAAESFHTWGPQGAVLDYDGDDDDYSPLAGVTVKTALADGVWLAGTKVESGDVDTDAHDFHTAARPLLRGLLRDARLQSDIAANRRERRIVDGGGRRSRLVAADRGPRTAQWRDQAAALAFPALPRHQRPGANVGDWAIAAEHNDEGVRRIGTVDATMIQVAAMNRLSENGTPFAGQRDALRVAFPSAPDRVVVETVRDWTGMDEPAREHAIARLRTLDQVG